MEPVITAKGRRRKIEKIRSKQREGEGKERRREGRGGEGKERKHPTTTALDKESIYNISKTSSMALCT